MSRITLTRSLRQSTRSDSIAISTVRKKGNPGRINIRFPEAVVRNLNWQKGDKIAIELDSDDGFAFAYRDREGKTLTGNGSSLFVQVKYLDFIYPEYHRSGYKIKDNTVEFDIQIKE